MFRSWTCSVLLLIAGASCAEDPKRPNIVLIVADDLGWADLGAYRDLAAHANQTSSAWIEDFLVAGEEVPPGGITPNIDRLADGGIRLTSFYANAPTCSPTRASILTGLYPQRFGVTQAILPKGPANHTPSDAGLPGNVQKTPTLPSLLGEAGYRTALFGKWHLGYSRDEHLPIANGFDEFFGYFGAGISRGRSSSDSICYAEHRRAPADTPQEIGSTNRRCAKQARCPDDADTVCSSRILPGFLTTTMTNHAIDYMEDYVESDGTAPFFVFLSYALPHAAGSFENPSGVPDRIRQRFEKNPPGGFAAMVQFLDEEVGRLLEAIDRLGLRDDTLVIFTSDNGGKGWTRGADQGWVSDHPCFGPGDPLTGEVSPVHDHCNGRLLGGKQFVYEGGIRVPFLLRWPSGFPLEERFDNGSVMLTMDLLPTLLDLVGGHVPPGLDGEVMDLRYRGWQREQPAFWFEPAALKEGLPNPHPQFAVRYRDWKLMRMPPTGNYSPMLFRISRERDGVTEILEEPGTCTLCIRPEEDQDLFPQGTERELVQWMLRAYHDWLAQFSEHDIRDRWLETVPLEPSVEGDLNGDGRADLAIQGLGEPGRGRVQLRLLDGIQTEASATPLKFKATWDLLGVARLGAEGRSRLVAQKRTEPDHGIMMLVDLGETGLVRNRLSWPGQLPRAESLVGIGDLNGDFVDDLVFLEDSGPSGAQLRAYLMYPHFALRGGDRENKATAVRAIGSLGRLSKSWRVVSVSDLDGDGRADILLEGLAGSPEAGVVRGLLTDSTGLGISRQVEPTVVKTQERLLGAGHFDSDTLADLVFEQRMGSGLRQLHIEKLLAGADGVAPLGSPVSLEPGQEVAAIANYDGLYGDDLALRTVQGRRAGELEIVLLDASGATVLKRGRLEDTAPQARVAGNVGLAGRRASPPPGQPAVD